MMYKRYNYRKPLFWSVLFLVIFLRTNTNLQSKKETYGYSTFAKLLYIQKGSAATGP